MFDFLWRKRRSTARTDTSSLTTVSNKPLEMEERPKGKALLRIIIAFWIIGLCNNYIYVTMLSAAHDVIDRVEAQKTHNGSKFGHEEPDDKQGKGRNCTNLTVGAILLADIVPTLVVKLISPFLPFYVHFRIILCVLSGVLSLVMVALANSMATALIGVAFASFNSGLGELTFLAYSTNFVLHAIASFSSGTGAAGLVGSFAYAGMTESGVTPKMVLFICILIPVLMSVSFWGILKHPPYYRNICANIPPSPETEEESGKSVKQQIKEKLIFTKRLLPFMIPVGLVYYFEYLINSGLFDKFSFENTNLSHHSQFRWFNVMYQIGVFISRSSVTWVHFKRIWIMSVFQAINFTILILDVLFGFIPNVWIVFVVILWEGLLGGAAYVNTFYNMSYMIEKEHRLFALSIASVADTFGIVLSGLSTFPLHKAICSIPFNPVLRLP